MLAKATRAKELENFMVPPHCHSVTQRHMELDRVEFDGTIELGRISCPSAKRKFCLSHFSDSPPVPTNVRYRG